MISIASRRIAYVLAGEPVRPLARRLKCQPNTLRAVAAGSTPKVDLALRIEAELEIPLVAWTIPVRLEDREEPQ
ncbi:MAG: hypothetical protein KF764_03080 [Labilithrix sp.]|nr:hypothetical protein [Labilithrix sp.]